MIYSFGSRADTSSQLFGRVAELADALDLGSNGVIRAGSTPVVPTNILLTLQRTRAYPRIKLNGNMNLTELLEKAASFWPQKPALVEGNSILTYAALLEEVNSWAGRFPVPAFSPGSRIGLAFPNGINYVALTYALWRLQVAVVPIPTECTEAEVEEIARMLQLDAIVSEKPRPGSVAIRPGCFLTRLQPAPGADNHGLNIAFIRFTSGTTSERKGVVLTHETIRDRIAAANSALSITSQDTVIWCLPMSHHFLVRKSVV